MKVGETLDLISSQLEEKILNIDAVEETDSRNKMSRISLKPTMICHN